MNHSLPGKTTLIRWSLSTLVALILLAAAYVWATLSYSYADGERAGFLVKLSHKGWVCKTWEGEMQMIAIPGAAPEKFYFTVRDDAVAAKINALLGRQITRLKGFDDDRRAANDAALGALAGLNCSGFLLLALQGLSESGHVSTPLEAGTWWHCGRLR